MTTRTLPSRFPLALALLATISSLSLQAEVRLPKFFSSHMVLQQGQPVTIWGWAEPHETVTVQIENQTAQAKANEKGEWKATLPALKAGAAVTVKVSGSSTVTLEDVLVGEVWLCSGQSNMEMGIKMCNDADQEVAAANYPQIRLLMVPNRWTPAPQTDIDATWKVCSPATIAEGGWGGFSASAYYFGRELHKELGVPVGLIDTTWGGTRIESWTPPAGFAEVPALAKQYELVKLSDPTTPQHKQQLEAVLQKTEEWVGASRTALKNGQAAPTMPTYPQELLPPHDLQQSTALYNGMIHPLCPMAIAGAIWYQGESNRGEGMLYYERMKALILGWRKIWGGAEFPFNFVQIAPYNYGDRPQAEAEIWEAQSASLAIPNTGMAVISDVGDLKDIHPGNKQAVGHRLALIALAKTYGRKELEYSGPTFKGMAAEGAKLRVQFDHVGGGLVSRDGKPLDWFEIIDAETGGFVKADAEINGASILLSSPTVTKPVAVRFGWHMLAEPNLANRAGLPASAFRAGTVPQRDNLKVYVPEAKDYQLVYDLDLTKAGATINYDQDKRAEIKKPFDRIAYFLELQTANDEVQYAFVSMDAFTTELGKIGVPTAASKAQFQQNVTGLNVLSNVKGVVNGSGLAGGNIEFWPGNYGMENTAGVTNASGSIYDFGDNPSEGADGYGSMQVHNHDARQTVFAVNHWREGDAADLGIGNRSTDAPDWTFARNAKNYEKRRLRVLVHCP